MRQHWSRWAKAGIAAFVIVIVAVGCKSTEDRIATTIAMQLEECRQSEETFYQFTTRDGDTYEVLAELCHLEPSEVNMVDEWRGIVTTGPATWTAEKDESRQGAVLMQRVAWPELEQALALHNRSSQDIEHMERAEEHFASAEEEYGDSAWVRQQRLDNLLKLRTETLANDDGETIVGDAAEAYLAEFVAWANEAGEQGARVGAQLSVVDHINGYRQRQERSLDRLGSGDRRWKARIGHAEDDGDRAEARRLQEEFEAILNERPAQEKRLQDLMERADREACSYTDQMTTDGIDDEGLRRRITSAKRQFDCDFAVADDEDGEEIAEEQ